MNELGKGKSQNKQCNYFDALKAGIQVFKPYFKAATADRNARRLYAQFNTMQTLLTKPPSFSWYNNGMFAFEMKAKSNRVDVKSATANIALSGYAINRVPPDARPPSDFVRPPRNALRRKGSKKVMHHVG